MPRSVSSGTLPPVVCTMGRQRTSSIVTVSKGESVSAFGASFFFSAQNRRTACTWRMERGARATAFVDSIGAAVSSAQQNSHRIDRRYGLREWREMCGVRTRSSHGDLAFSRRAAATRKELHGMKPRSTHTTGDHHTPNTGHVHTAMQDKCTHRCKMCHVSLRAHT